MYQVPIRSFDVDTSCCIHKCSHHLHTPNANAAIIIIIHSLLFCSCDSSLSHSGCKQEVAVILTFFACTLW